MIRILAAVKVVLHVHAAVRTDETWNAVLKLSPSSTK